MFSSTTMLIYAFCKICKHEITFVTKIKTKQFQVRNFVHKSYCTLLKMKEVWPRIHLVVSTVFPHTYSCRGNYSFLNSSSEETIQGEVTIQGRKLFEEIRYL